MNVEKYIVSLAKVSRALSIKTLDEMVITALKTHQSKQLKQQGELTIYCSQVNPYNNMYSGKGLSNTYKKQVEQQLRMILRAFGVKDITYTVQVEYHPNAVW